MALAAAIFLAVFVLPRPWGAIAIVVGTVIEVAEAVFWIKLSRRRQPVTGAEGLIGARGLVMEPCRPEGYVRVKGELWRARCEEGADPGETVRVRTLDGLTLIVEHT